MIGGRVRFGSLLEHSLSASEGAPAPVGCVPELVHLFSAETYSNRRNASRQKYVRMIRPAPFCPAFAASDVVMLRGDGALKSSVSTDSTLAHG